MIPNHAVIVMVCSGLASPVLMAQEFSLSLVGAPATIDSTGGATFTMTVVGDASVGQFYTVAAFSIQSSSELIVDMSWQHAIWSNFPSDGGYTGNGNYNEVIAAQLFCVHTQVCPPHPDSAIGLEIGRFTVHIAADVEGQIDFEMIGGWPFSLEVVDWDTGVYINDTQGSLTLNGTSIKVVPGVPSISLLALGALTTTRRNRKTA